RFRRPLDRPMLPVYSRISVRGAVDWRGHRSQFVSPAPASRRVVMREPTALLRWVDERPERISLAALDVIDVWGLVALAALARDGASPAVSTEGGATGAARFAHALGFDDVLTGEGMIARPPEEERTVRLRRVRRFEEVEPAADAISRLIV